jgi:hypothetical protein
VIPFRLEAIRCVPIKGFFDLGGSYLMRLYRVPMIAAFVLGCVFPTLSSPINPGGPCGTASLSDYIALGPAGCTEVTAFNSAGVTLNDFSYSAITTGTATASAAQDVLVTPSTLGGAAVGFIFDGLWDAAAQSSVTFSLRYNVIVPDTGVGMDRAFFGFGFCCGGTLTTGAARIVDTLEVCVPQVSGCPPSNPLLTLVLDTNVPPGILPTNGAFPKTSFLTMEETFEVTGGSEGEADFTRFTSFDSPSEEPEPPYTEAFTVGFGLLFLALVKRQASTLTPGAG